MVSEISHKKEEVDFLQIPSVSQVGLQVIIAEIENHLKFD